MLLDQKPIKPTPDARLRILVLCAELPAHNIIAEARFNSVGSAHFLACCTGSQPTGQIHPLALANEDDNQHRATELVARMAQFSEQMPAVKYSDGGP